MTKHKIIKKVKELSEKIAKFMDAHDEDIGLAPSLVDSLVDSDTVLYLPDFLVGPQPASCMCFYGGEKLSCNVDDTTLERSADDREKLPEHLFHTCVVRKYSEAYKAGIKLLREQE